MVTMFRNGIERNVADDPGGIKLLENCGWVMEGHGPDPKNKESHYPPKQQAKRKALGKLR